MQELLHRRCHADLIAVSVYDGNSVGPSTQPICTRWCFTMTNMIQACSNFIEPEYLSYTLVRIRSMRSAVPLPSEEETTHKVVKTLVLK